jgi:hypothetical protein
MLGLEAREVTSFTMREMHPLSPAMEGKAYTKANFTLASDMGHFKANLKQQCEDHGAGLLHQAPHHEVKGLNFRLSLATVGKVEQRNREESMGRIMDSWVWDKLVMDWSQCKDNDGELEMRLLILTTSTAELTWLSKADSTS